jgi:hypothetical protein
VAVAGGRASVLLLVAVFFVTATAETVFDSAWQATCPWWSTGATCRGPTAGCRLVSWGTLSIGAAAGGAVFARFGLRVLYGAAAAIVLGLAVLAWRLLDPGSFAAAREAAPPSPDPGSA